MLPQIRERLGMYNARAIDCPQSKCAGVIIPLLSKNGDLHVLLTKRTTTVRYHKGEVSFPGGMCEDSDGGTLETALRECCEEIGVKKSHVEVIGRLDDMITLTGFVITPYVGIIPYPYEFRISPREVDHLIYLPVGYLLEADPVFEPFPRDGHIERVPSFHYEGNRIWGATCRMLLQFRKIVFHEAV